MEHEFLVRYTEKALLNQGFTVTKSQYAATAGGNRFFGLMQITGNNIDGNGETETGYNRLLGLRNSFDRSMSAGIAVGAQVISL